MIFYELVSIKYNVCIIMPTISPFGVDGNNTKSLSPFDIKGKGQIKIFSSFAIHTPPECLLKSLNELPPLYMPRCTNMSMLPLSTCWVSTLLKCVVHAPLDCRQDLQKDVLQEEHDSILNDLPITKDSYINTSLNQVRIYKYWLIHPSKWAYTRSLLMINKYIMSFILGIEGKPKKVVTWHW